MSTFLARASASDERARIQAINGLIQKLSNEPRLRDIGWVVSHKPLNKFGSKFGNVSTLGIGDWYTNTTVQLDKNILSRTDRVLQSLGWSRDSSNNRRKWCYVTDLDGSAVKVCLTWHLGQAIVTDDHALGRRQYPIKYVELFVEDGYVN